MRTAFSSTLILRTYHRRLESGTWYSQINKIELEYRFTIHLNQCTVHRIYGHSRAKTTGTGHALFAYKTRHSHGMWFTGRGGTAGTAESMYAETKGGS